MQALILAAGMGRRLAEYTEDKTKCMVKVLDKTLIERNLDILVQYPLKRIILVVGYKGKDVEDLIGSEYKGIPVKYVYNEDYATTNNIYSLYMAKDSFREDETILLESDLIFEKKVLDCIINSPDENAVLVASHRPWMDGTVVEIGKDREILRFVGKSEFKYKESEKYYKTVNIYKLSKEFIHKSYIPFLKAYITSEGVNEYYEQVLSVINFFNKRNLKACILDDESLWYEIDDKQDLSNAELLFSDDKKLDLYQKRYGGYWRFPNLLDFCYLVNPYFPDKTMIKEMKHSFDPLLRDYPSGLATQNLLCSKMFNVNEEYILTGNGAAELINGLMTVLSDRKVGFILPTFNEYAERVCEENRVFFYVEKEDFSYSKEDVIFWSEEADALVLINPDNPSGNFISPKDLFDILESFKKRNKILVLDESFVDFSTEGPENTLISNKNLRDYPNLLVMKSISKSYGVPGIRLGVLASGNKEIMARVRSKISIWNINSFGEFFLQIYGKYEKSYLLACQKIAAERDRFFKTLQKISYLQTYESQANYFLCRVKGKDSTELVASILKEHNILLKDLHGKSGFEGKNCIRIAVRSKKENKCLIDILKRYEG